MIIKERRRASLSGKLRFPFTATPASLSKAGAKELVPREPEMFEGGMLHQEAWGLDVGGI